MISFCWVPMKPRGLRCFRGAFAVPNVRNDARSIDLALSLVMRKHFSCGDDVSAPFGPTLGPVSSQPLDEPQDLLERLPWHRDLGHLKDGVLEGDGHQA